MLVAGEYAALAMTLLALLGALVALFVYTGNSLWQGGDVPAPKLTGKKEDTIELSTFYSTQLYRQQARTEYRAAVTQSIAYLAATAVGFLAVALFFRATRTMAEEPQTTRATHWDQVGRFAPGMVTLVCATLIFIFARPSESAPPTTTLPIAPPAFSFAPITTS
jgi:hypothetical protein